MKKRYLVLVFGILLLIGLSASAYAAVTIGGMIQFRGWSQATDTDKNTPQANYYDTRVRLSFDDKINDNLEAMIEFENNNAGGDFAQWGTGTYKGQGVYKVGDSFVPGNASLRQAWILYKFSSIPLAMKVGHQPLSLGHKIFFDHTRFGDDAIVLISNPSKELTLLALTIKLKEGLTTISHDDGDAYVGLVSYKVDDKNTVGFNVTHVRQRDFASVTPLSNTAITNLMGTADGSLANVDYRVELDWQFGDVVNNALAKVKAKGLAFLLGADYKVDPVKLSADWVYGSGVNSSDTDMKGFINAVGLDQHYTLVHELSVAGPAGLHGGIFNTMYVRLGASGDFTKELNAGLDLYRLWASRTNPGISKDVGWEVDGKAVYKLDKNLAYQVDAGYFKPGSWYSDQGMPKDGAYVLRHMLTLTF